MPLGQFGRIFCCNLSFWNGSIERIESANMADVNEFDEFSIQCWKAWLEYLVQRKKKRAKNKCDSWFDTLIFQFNEPLSWETLTDQIRLNTICIRKQADWDGIQIFAWNTIILFQFLFCKRFSFFLGMYRTCIRRPYERKTCQVNAWKIQMRYPTVKSRVHRQIDISYDAPVKCDRMIYNYLVMEDGHCSSGPRPTMSSYSLPTHYIKIVFLFLCMYLSFPVRVSCASLSPFVRFS